MCTPDAATNIVNFFKTVGGFIVKAGKAINSAAQSAGGWSNVAFQTSKIAGTAASTAVSINAAKQSAKAQQQEALLKAKQDKQNAQTAQENANRERQQGIEEARLQRLKAAQNVANQTSAMAANGIDVTQGTPVDFLGDTAMWGEMDALNTLANSESRAQAYEAQVNNFQNQARLDSLAGQNAYRAGQINSITAGLNGISNAMGVAEKWYGFSGNSTSGTQTASTNPTGIKVKNSFKNKVAMNTVI